MTRQRRALDSSAEHPPVMVSWCCFFLSFRSRGADATRCRSHLPLSVIALGRRRGADTAALAVFCPATNGHRRHQRLCSHRRSPTSVELFMTQACIGKNFTQIVDQVSADGALDDVLVAAFRCKR